MIVLSTNREIIDLIGKAWPQTERLFESVNQSSVTLLRLSAKRLIFTFLLKDLSAKRSVPVLLINREKIVLIEKTWPQSARLFESANQSCINSLSLSAKKNIYHFLC